MCCMEEHRCNVCRRTYECDVLDRDCPTLNEDADANLCEKCMKRFGDDAQKYWDELGVNGES